MSRAAPDPSAPAAGRVLAAADRAVARLENGLNLVAALSVFALMLFVVLEVLGRRLFNYPIPGHIDWVELGMATFAFLGIAYCQRLGGHVRMELLVSRLRGRAMWAAEAVATAILLFIVAVLVKGTWDHFWRAWALGDTTMDIRLQTWPSKLLAPVALALLGARLLLQLWGYCRLIASPRARPLAVPVTLALHEQARREIEEAGVGGGPAERG